MFPSVIVVLGHLSVQISLRFKDLGWEFYRTYKTLNVGGDLLLSGREVWSSRFGVSLRASFRRLLLFVR